MGKNVVKSKRGNDFTMLQKYFTEITDPRQQVKVKHKLLEIVVMTICAVIAGCEAWEDIFDYCCIKEEWFRKSLGMKWGHGIYNVLSGWADVYWYFIHDEY